VYFNIIKQFLLLQLTLKVIGLLQDTV